MTAHLFAGTGACPPSAAPLSIQELAAIPERYLKRSVHLTGTLVNLGANYFTDRRLALKDATGNTIAVEPLLPLESPPGEGGETPTLASYLGKKVEIRGELDRKPDDGESLVLDVESAAVVPPR